MAKIFDTHSHYDDIKFDEVRDELLSSLESRNVGKVITCGVDMPSSLRSKKLAEKYDYIYFAAGIHPENMDEACDTDFIKDLSEHEKCVAVGEIGLDYYFDPSSAEKQKQVFEKQLILSKELNLPVIVHDRDAHADTLELLKKHRPKGVVHCFSGSPETAKEIVSLGMYIGIGGVITFKNAKRLPEVAKELPLDRLLLETDCPYLAPEPFRGKLCNSAMIEYTAKRLAEIRNISYEEVLDAAFENAMNLFF